MGTGCPVGTRDYSLSALGLKTSTEMKDLFIVKENTRCWASERLAFLPSPKVPLVLHEGKPAKAKFYTEIWAERK